MGYMEIAGYLASLNIAICEGLKQKDNDYQRKMIEALRQAEMIMFRLAVDELAETIKEKK